MQKGEMRFRRFKVVVPTTNGGRGVDTGGRVTAAIVYHGCKGDINNPTEYDWYSVQFSYCSPKERNENKKLGQFIAEARLYSRVYNRGGIMFSVVHPNQGLTTMIKGLIVDEAERKMIRWMMKLPKHYQLV